MCKRPIRRRSCCLTWYVALVLGSAALGNSLVPAAACAAEKDQPAVKKRQETIRLDLKMQPEQGKDLLHVTLTNISKKPIVVDRKLIFGLSFGCIDDRGDRASTEMLPYESPPRRPWTIEQWKERMATLQPGQSVARAIDLYGGYKCQDFFLLSFPHGARGRPFLPEQMERISKEALEGPGRQLRYIWVTYSVSRYTLRELKYMTKLEAPVDEVYRGEAYRGLDLKTGKMFGVGEYSKLPLAPSLDEISMRMDLKMERKREKELLRVTLTNISKKPIVVDGKLVFGLSFQCGDDRDDWAPTQVLRYKPPPLPPWTIKQWKERVVTLQPGQSVARLIDLYGGYECHDLFSHGYRQGRPVEGVRTMERVNKEAMQKQGTNLRHISVGYIVTGHTLWALKKFTGLKAPVEELHMGSAVRGLDAKTGKMQFF